MEATTSRRSWAGDWLSVAAILLVGGLLSLAIGAMQVKGASVTPILVPDAANQTCQQLANTYSPGSTWTEFKFDPNPDRGRAVHRRRRHPDPSRSRMPVRRASTGPRTSVSMPSSSRAAQLATTCTSTTSPGHRTRNPSATQVSSRRVATRSATSRSATTWSSRCRRRPCPRSTEPGHGASTRARIRLTSRCPRASCSRSTTRSRSAPSPTTRTLPSVATSPLTTQLRRRQRSAASPMSLLPAT